jgi:hypothetical protein
MKFYVRFRVFHGVFLLDLADFCHGELGDFARRIAHGTHFGKTVTPNLGIGGARVGIFTTELTAARSEDWTNRDRGFARITRIKLQAKKPNWTLREKVDAAVAGAGWGVGVAKFVRPNFRPARSWVTGELRRSVRHHAAVNW